MLKKVTVGSMAIVSVFAIIGGATLAQIFPIFVFFLLAYQNMKLGIDTKLIIVLLAVFMILVNLAMWSPIDLAFWALIMVAFWKD